MDNVSYAAILNVSTDSDAASRLNNCLIVLTKSTNKLKTDFQYLRAIRKKLDFTQVEMAMLLGLNRSYLAELETGKRVITARLAHKVKQIVKQVEMIDAAPALSDKNADNIAYFDYLKNSLASMSLEELDEITNYFYERDFEAPSHMVPFYAPILNLISLEIMQRKILKRRINNTPEPVSTNDDLTKAETTAICGDVKPQMPVLLERIKKAASVSGKKSELAAFLNAPLASVSRWLSGEREPGGEITLQMLKWVEQQERQK